MPRDVQRNVAAMFWGMGVAVVPSSSPRHMKEVVEVLAAGRASSIDGAEITIDRAWCNKGYQLGVGLDERGRRIAFSISLSTGKGSAAPL